jgi:hypothetical protein
MTRINALRNTRSFVTSSFMTWGKNAGALIFAAVLIVCSVTLGCSSDKPKTISSSNQIPVPQTPSAIEPAPVMQAENKPAPKKIVRKKPATVNYSDKSSGLTFEYSRRYAIETGDAANDLVASSALPMNFVMPGGVAIAAVELPETGFANTDFSSAFFDVSVHKNLTADQCSEFAVPQPKNVVPVASTEAATAPAAPASTQTASSQTTAATTETATASAQPATEQSAAAQPTAAGTTATAAPVTASAAQSQPEPQGSKLMIGDLELRGTEAVTGEGTRQSDSKYFHVFQNGSCYEFALNVTTVASEEGITKHVDRDKVFSRLEAILSTVKIDAGKIDTGKVDASKTNPAAPEVAAEAPKTPAASGNPAQ